MKRRLGDRLDIVWKAFLLRPKPSERSREVFVAYTESWRRPDSMEPDAKLVVWSSDDDPPTHSMPAHVAAKVVASFAPDRYEPYHHSLLRAYFTENRTISDYEVLAAVAEESGVDRAAFWSELDIGRSDAANATIDEHNEAIEQGITAVPTVLASGFAVPGAQDVDTYVRLFERMYERAG